MRDRSKYGCWNNKYKEFTLRCKVPLFEPFTKIIGYLDEDNGDALFDIHKDEEQFCGRSLSPTTDTDLVQI